MRNLSTAVIAALILAAQASAHIEVWWEPVANDVAPGADALHPNFNDGTYHTFDLMAFSDEGAWSTAEGNMTITGGSFFDHVINSNGPIMVNPAFPATEFDSVWHGPYGSLLFSPAPITTDPQLRFAGWGDTNANQNPPGAYVIARVTVQYDTSSNPPITLDWVGRMGRVGTFELFDTAASIVIPEPAMGLPLLLLGALGLRRR